MLVDVGLQDRVEVLELDVADQSDDEDLEENRNASNTGVTSIYRSRSSFLEPHQSVEHQRVVRLLV